MNIKSILVTHKSKVLFIVILLIAYYFSLPTQLFKNPTSTVVTASNNELLGAVIADDGQWRFPEVDSVPKKFEHCILQFEDAYFNQHFGFNPVSIFKALSKNINAKRVVRGGSTLTQQVIRLSRKNKQRSYLEKFIELILATRLEFRNSKKEILKLFASNAPFGGNVVGLEMASWRYFGLKPYQLSWAESAALAVLPNAPSLIYPGKNQEKLRKKRNRLLKKLYKQSIIDSITYVLAIEEELPKKPYNLPRIAPHLVQEIANTHKGKRLHSSIDFHLQQQVNLLAKQYYERHRQNEVYNLAILVIDVKTRKVLAYVGNSPTDKKHQKDVNNILAPRSTGSVLKPILYAQMLQSGDLLPNQLVADVPTEIAGYTPKNFDLTYEGAVPASIALARSLNVPAVRMLRRYGLSKFITDLKDYQFKYINQSADYYGLSIILGGGEANLWNICKVFAGYAGVVNHYEELSHNYYQNEFIEQSFQNSFKPNFGKVTKEPQIVDAGSTFLTLNTLTEVNRTATDQAWKYYSSSQKVGWKTGTSFGNRDAWSVGVTPKYVVGVWFGNSDGEGRSDLTGAGVASPLMFDVFGILPKSNWFLEPYEDMVEENICVQSGFLALPICDSEKRYIQKNGLKTKSCPYHKLVQLDKNEQFQVNSNCESVSRILTKPWFELPPLMAYYYQQNNSDYKALPEFSSKCNELEGDKMNFIFPTKKRTTISLTKGVNGKLNPVVLKLTHSNKGVKIYWYLNNKFIRTTKDAHEIAIKPGKGQYIITVVDDFGNEEKRILVID